MNNPKEEAKRLLDRFDYQVRDNDGECALTRDESKQCALICVEEMINSAVSMKGFKKMYPIGFIEHWQKVKTEIEAL